MENNAKKELAQKVGNRIYELRKKNNLTREKFAELCDITSQNVYYLEKGDGLPSCITLIDMCNQFHISPSKLLFDPGEKEETIFNETLLTNFNKLSTQDKNFVINMVDSMINLLLENTKKSSK